MALPINRIGPFKFVSLDGAPQHAQYMMSVRSSAGMTGVQVQRLGRMGKPFSVLSFADAPTYLDAQSLAYQYSQLPGTNAAALFLGSVPQASWDLAVFVIDVQIVALKATIHGNGGLNGTSKAFIRAKWTLQPVRITDQA